MLPGFLAGPSASAGPLNARAPSADNSQPACFVFVEVFMLKVPLRFIGRGERSGALTSSLTMLINGNL